MNESSNRYDADVKWMRLMATMRLKKNLSVLKEVKEGVRRQSSASTYGEKCQFDIGIQISISYEPSEGWKNDQPKIRCFLL